MPIILEKLSGPKLRAEIAKRSAEQSRLIDAAIAAGMGEMRHSDIVELAKGSSLLSKVLLAREYLAASEAFHAAHEEMAARKRYHGGDKPIRRRA